MPVSDKPVKSISGRTFSKAFDIQSYHFQSAISTLEELIKDISTKLGNSGHRCAIPIPFQNGNHKEQILFHTSMALMKKLLSEAQAKFRKMVEENRDIANKIDNEIHHANEEITTLRNELTDTRGRLEQLSIRPTPTGQLQDRSNNRQSDFESGSPILTDKWSSHHNRSKRANNIYEASSSGSNDNVNANVIMDEERRRRSKKSKRHSRRRAELEYQEDTEPPSPTPGPSCRNEFCLIQGGMSEETVSFALENERLRDEVFELRKLLANQGETSPQGVKIEDVTLELHPDLDGCERIRALEQEIMRAKDTITVLNKELGKLKSEKFDLVNQMRGLYEALDEKDNETRNLIRNHEMNFLQRIQECHEDIEHERVERERERWALLRHVRDESEKNMALRVQLELKDKQLREFNLHQFGGGGGYLSDQDSIVSGRINGRITPSTGLNNVMAAGANGNVDSVVRGNSERESGAASAGGNLSDSPADGTPTITIDGIPHKRRSHYRYPDADSISIVSSSAIPHIYQSVATPRDSPSLSPMNAQSIAKSLDNAILSKSVEQLSSPPPESEPIRRSKNLRSFSGKSGMSSTWGSISRVFSRNRHRKSSGSPGSHDGDGYGRTWSPLTEEGYTEKLRLLKEAAHIPMERWRAPTVLAWIEVALGMPQYGPRCADNIKSGKVLLELTDPELESVLKISNLMHRKKLRLAIEENRNPNIIRYPCLAQLGHTWVCNEWLPDIGLPQYAEIFGKNMVDARMLEHMSKKDLEKYLNVTRKFHYVSITSGISLLRIVKYDRQALALRRLECEKENKDPLVWTNQRFIQWAKDIHLEEYADNLKESGVHGAMVVLERSVTGETMATALGIPPTRQMIRRHLTAELEQLILPARYTIFPQSEPIYEMPNNICRTSQEYQELDME